VPPLLRMRRPLDEGYGCAHHAAVAEHKSETGAPPDFVNESMGEVRLFVRTFAQFTLHPMDFSNDWAQGRCRAMNPVGFFGTALGLQLAAVAIVTHFKPDEIREALKELMPRYFWLAEFFSSQLPLLRAAVFAAVVHAWLSRRSRQPFRASLGVVFYAAGWAALCRAATAPLGLLSSTYPSKIAASVIGLVGLVVVALALAGVHRLRRWTAALAPMAAGTVLVMLFSFVATTLMAGAYSPSGAERLIRAIEKREAGVKPDDTIK
jgi:hypothetical protein